MEQIIVLVVLAWILSLFIGVPIVRMLVRGVATTIGGILFFLAVFYVQAFATIVTIAGWLIVLAAIYIAYRLARALIRTLIRTLRGDRRPPHDIPPLW